MKKQKKAFKKFKIVLKSLKDIKEESTYEDYKTIIDENASHYALIHEDYRKQIFNDYKSEYLKVNFIELSFYIIT